MIKHGAALSAVEKVAKNKDNYIAFLFLNALFMIASFAFASCAYFIKDDLSERYTAALTIIGTVDRRTLAMESDHTGERLDALLNHLNLGCYREEPADCAVYKVTTKNQAGAREINSKGERIYFFN
jgi:hypothetical protein